MNTSKISLCSIFGAFRVNLSGNFLSQKHFINTCTRGIGDFCMTKIGQVQASQVSRNNYDLKNNTQKQKEKIEVFPQHGPIAQGQHFHEFMHEVDNAQSELINDIKNGKITTEEQRQTRHSEVANMTFDVTGDEYRALASKKNKTPEEIQQMKDLYKEGFLKFGTSYTAFLDKKYGNGDGILTKEEYINSEMQDIPEELKEFANPQDAENIFSHIDLNKDGKISPEEMATLGSMVDMSVGLEGDKAGGVNGKIKACDLNANMLNMVKPSDTTGGRAMDNKMQTMNNFLFGDN